MKTRLFLFLVVASIAFTSCNLSSSSNKSPQIFFVTNPFVNKSDSLNSYLTDDGVYHMDTINVGDTVTFRILLYGYANNLLTCNITQSDTTSTKILFPGKNSLDSIFVSATSDYTNGKFIFKNKISSLYFPFKYVARKATKDAKISFYLSSDANFDNSSSIGGGGNAVSFVLQTPVKQPK
ncbi:MAG: hypothetical protein Q8904_05585 [Bacteroidota bacterium]|nr:hypothetical protein [Bacteroidota bacterium]